MTRVVAALLATLIAIPAPAHAYLKFGVRIGDRTVDVKWTRFPIQYFVTDRGVPEVSVTELRDAIARAFATWQAVSTANVRAEFQGLTIAPPGFQDGRTTLGFLDRPELERVLGATSFLLDSTTGEILEADIFFNTRFTWSTAAGGEGGRVDLESVALHEIGHLLGLGHSALGETELLPSGGRRLIASGAVMFPIAMSAGTIADRQVQPDDITGMSDLYPAGAFLNDTGSISGRVTLDGTGRGVFGAHVVAFHPETGVLIGSFTLNQQGDFVVAGLTPGAYILRVEPLDDAEADSFLSGPVDVSFRVTYAHKVVVAPRGGSSGPVEIRVRPR